MPNDTFNDPTNTDADVEDFVTIKGRVKSTQKLEKCHKSIDPGHVLLSNLVRAIRVLLQEISGVLDSDHVARLGESFSVSRN